MIRTSSQLVTLYAHRGASAELPENTLAAFLRALELGADAIETDVHATADGYIVVSHDPDGRRMTGVAAEIRRSTLADVRRWDAGFGFETPDGDRPFARRGLRIPTLEEVLVELPNVQLNVDVKPRSPSIVPALLSLLAAHRAEQRVRLTSFHDDVVRAIRAAGYPGPTGMSEREVLLATLLPSPLLARLRLRELAVQVPPRARGIDLASPRLLDKWHRLGLRVDYWVIDDPAEASNLVARGADGIMTNDVRRVAPAVRTAADRSGRGVRRERGT